MSVVKLDRSSPGATMPRPHSFVSVLLGAVMFVGSAGIANAVEPIKMRWASDHGGPPHPAAIAEVYFAEQVEKQIPGSKVQIYRLMDQLAASGKGVLFVSSYLPELLGVCDTIGVMCRGTLSEVRPVADWTEHNIISAAIGQTE